MAIIIDEKNAPRPAVTDAERAAVAGSGAGRVADKHRAPEKPAEPAQQPTRSES